MCHLHKPHHTNNKTSLGLQICIRALTNLAGLCTEDPLFHIPMDNSRARRTQLIQKANIQFPVVLIDMHLTPKRSLLSLVMVVCHFRNPYLITGLLTSSTIPSLPTSNTIMGLVTT